MTVTVTALRYHTLRGEEHQPGDRYEVEAEDVDNLQAQGMATAASIETNGSETSETPKKRATKNHA